MPKNIIDLPAPEFSLPDESGKTHSLKDYLGKYVLLYFYPKDMTSGCTAEAQCFRDNLNELKKENVQVFGVSADNQQSHQEFKQIHNLNFPLLSDTDKKVMKKYGVINEKTILGRIMSKISRESFLIDPNGKIIKHYKKVKPEKHANEVLEDMKHLNSK